MQQEDGQHAAEILLVQPTDYVRNLEMAVPDAVFQHRGNAVAAVQQALLVVALDRDVGQLIGGDAQIRGVHRPEQALLGAAILDEKPERLVRVVERAERHDCQVSEPQHVTGFDEVRRVHRVLVGGGCALAHVDRNAAFQQLRGGFRVVLMLMADQTRGNARHAVAEPLLQFLERQSALQQQRGFAVRHDVGVAAGAARQ